MSSYCLYIAVLFRYRSIRTVFGAISLSLNTHGLRRYLAIAQYAPLRPAMCTTASRSVRIRRADYNWFS